MFVQILHMSQRYPVESTFNADSSPAYCQGRMLCQWNLCGRALCSATDKPPYVNTILSR